MRAILLTIAALGITWGTARAQESISADVKNAMEKLSFLEGRWEGVGNMMTGPNQTSEAKVVEVGSFKLRRTVFVFEGTGVATNPDGTKRNVHDALGIISYDSKAKQYRLRTYRAGGEHLSPSITLKGQSILWSFKDPVRGNKIRFTLSVKDDVWTEIGEVNVGGDRWMKFFDMKLRKQVPKKKVK